MRRISWALIAGMILAAPGLTHAAEEGPAGSWKVTLMQSVPETLWLVALESKDGKWTGKVLGQGPELPPSTLEAPVVDKDRIRFDIKVGNQRASFDGKVRPDTRVVLGTLIIGKDVHFAQLEPTALKSWDAYEMAREVVAGKAADTRLFGAVDSLLAAATTKKATPEEVRGWADRAYKAAEPYGARWQREAASRTTMALAEQKAYATIALEYARKAERLLEANDKPNVQGSILMALAEALKNAGKVDEAKEVEARIKKIEPIKLDTFAGRKAKSERVVLVELFTGAECPPCVAADMAFDALGKTYKPGEVVFLEYHLHVPGPDPLSNADTAARQQFYGDVVEGTPTILFSGLPGPDEGGGRFEAQSKYEQYRQVADKVLEMPAKAQLKAAAVRKGAKIEITADVMDLDGPLDKVRLRFALIEEEVLYKGGNKIESYHNVVRALPGGPKGLALKKKTESQSVSVDVDELRKDLKKYLDDYAKKEESPNKDRPLELKKLRVVAFLQNDQTREVLQAVQVEVTGEK